MPPFYLAILLGFFVGTFGYILTYFLLLPMIRYGRIKKRIAAALSEKENKGNAKQLRLLSDELTECVNDRLPVWHRLSLQRKQEAPIEAAKLLLKLPRTENPRHRGRQIEEIKRHLRMR